MATDHVNEKELATLHVESDHCSESSSEKNCYWCPA